MVKEFFHLLCTNNALYYPKILIFTISKKIFWMNTFPLFYISGMIALSISYPSSPKWSRWFSTWWVSGVLDGCEWSRSSRWSALLDFLRLELSTMHASCSHLLLRWLFLSFWKFFIGGPWWWAYLSFWLYLSTSWGLANCSNFTAVSESIIRAIVVSKTKAALSSWLMMHFHGGLALAMLTEIHFLFN